jgi:hypothetical protein
LIPLDAEVTSRVVESGYTAVTVSWAVAPALDSETGALDANRNVSGIGSRSWKTIAGTLTARFVTTVKYSV